jgi:hypothetical protein
MKRTPIVSRFRCAGGRGGGGRRFAGKAASNESVDGSKGATVIIKYACRTQVKTDKCTDMRVSLGMKSGEYCRMCYRKQLTTELLAKERKNRCRTSAMGCPICKEPICKECWKERYDKHA